MNISDWEFLLTRSTSPSNLLLFNNSIRLFTDKMSIAKYNDLKLGSLNNIKALHSMCRARSIDDEQLSGLGKSFFLSAGAKIVFTCNIWTEMGIVNGALGVVRDIVYPRQKLLKTQPDLVFIEIEDYVGPQFFSDADRKNWIPVNTLTIYSPEVKASRTQYQLKLAYAMTIHKAQGLTLKQVFICYI
jgi:ATP-dependent DNA helicase PIF1